MKVVTLISSLLLLATSSIVFGLGRENVTLTRKTIHADGSVVVLSVTYTQSQAANMKAPFDMNEVGYEEPCIKVFSVTEYRPGMVESKETGKEEPAMVVQKTSSVNRTYEGKAFKSLKTKVDLLSNKTSYKFERQPTALDGAQIIETATYTNNKEEKLLRHFGCAGGAGNASSSGDLVSNDPVAINFTAVLNEAAQALKLNEEEAQAE